MKRKGQGDENFSPREREREREDRSRERIEEGHFFWRRLNLYLPNSPHIDMIYKYDIYDMITLIIGFLQTDGWIDWKLFY